MEVEEGHYQVWKGPQGIGGGLLNLCQVLVEEVEAELKYSQMCLPLCLKLLMLGVQCSEVGAVLGEGSERRVDEEGHSAVAVISQEVLLQKCLAE
jgi:hypothetical protein